MKRPMDERVVLITGASGLLGRSLTARFLADGFQVLAQFHLHAGKTSGGIRWLHGDLSSPEGVNGFLKSHRALLKKCRYLVNNYGPLTPKPTRLLTAGDFLADLQCHLLSAVEITRFLIARGDLRAMVSIGFGFAGQIRPYRKILSYAVAKNALLLFTKSLAREFPAIRCNMVSFSTLVGARFPVPSGTRGAGVPVTPEKVSDLVLRILLGSASARHFHI